MVKSNKLIRQTKGRLIAGVAGGLAEYFGIDTGLVRLMFILTTGFGGGGVVVYFLLWLFLPEGVNGGTVEDTVRHNAEEIKGQAEQVVREVQKTIKLHENKQPRSNIKPEASGRPWLGMVLIIIGALFLLNNFGLFVRWDIFWPVVLIALGIIVIVRK